MNFRSRRFLDLARGQPCFVQSPECRGAGTEHTVSCHSNAQRHGHGTSIKAHDCFSVPGCDRCNWYLDQGPAPRGEKEELFMAAWERWILHLMAAGKLVVKGAKAAVEPMYKPSSKIMPRRVA